MERICELNCREGLRQLRVIGVKIKCRLKKRKKGGTARNRPYIVRTILFYYEG